MKPARSRTSVVLRIAAAVSIAIVLVVAFATSRWRTAETPAVASPSRASATDEIPTAPIDALEETSSRVAVRPAPATPRPRPQQATVLPTPPPASPGKIRIVGDVRDTSGRPLDAESGSIWCRNVAGTKWSEIRGTAYRIDGLDAGPVNLECKAHGYRQQLRRIALLPGESEHHEDFVLEPDWFVDVQLVTPSGRTLNRESAKEFLPEGSFHFAVSVAPPPERWTPGSSEERRGRRLVGEGFETPLMEGSFLRLTILGDPPLHVSVDVRGTVLASTRLDTRVEQASLVLPVDRFASLRGSFTCVVLDSETNTPFPRAHASLSGVGIYTPERFDADPTGRIQRGNLIPGRYALSLRAQGPVEGTWSARTIRTFDVQESSETDLGTITLDPSQHVQGRFVDARGQPVAGKGTVRPLSLDDAVAWMPEELGMQLGERPSGGFARDGLGKERYVLVASGRPWGNPKGDLLVASVVVDLREGSIDDLVVTLEVAHPVCIRAETDEAKDFVYRLADAAGVPFVHGVLTQPRTHWLAPGNYRALVGPDAGHLREIPFTHGTEALTIKVEP